MIDTFYPIGSVYISADKTKTKADFPFMAYGIWEEVPDNLCLQTGNASEAGIREVLDCRILQGVLLHSGSLTKMIYMEGIKVTKIIGMEP